jgi:hypothetical protein
MLFCAMTSKREEEKTMHTKTSSMILASVPLATVLLATVLLTTVASAQNRIALAPLAGGDLAASELQAPLGLKAAVLPTEPASMSWGLDPQKALDLNPAPFVARSREYFLDLSAAELRHGIDLPTDGAGALVRLNPAPGSKGSAPIDPLRVSIITADKRTFAQGTGFDQMASANQLKAAGSPFVEGTTAFRLNSEVGAGTHRLRVEGLHDGGRYVVHVFDQNSPVELVLSTNRGTYLSGQNLVVKARLAGGLPAHKVEGFVTSPAGRAWPLTFEPAGKGLFRATLLLDGLETPTPGLWEAHVSATGGKGRAQTLRQSRTAFDVAVASARLNGEVALVSGIEALAIRLGVESAALGRYEIRGVLFGTTGDGQMLPAAVAHSADTLHSGHGSLVLSFDTAAAQAAGLGAPYEVRDLRLMDQGTMGLLHQQRVGLVIQ